jgi:two-component system, LytTR family, sensor histidine kinase AlgZ
MHPILARGGRLALYVAVWALAGVLLAALFGGTGGLSRIQSLAVAMPLALTYAFFCLSSWYVSRSMPLAATGILRLTTTALTAALISGAVWLALTRGWIEVLARRGAAFDAAVAFDRIEGLVFGFGVLLYLLSLAVSHLIGSFEQSRDIERRALEVQVLAREAELQSLRAQIDPHFLFNSLHSISALTATDPAAARRMCVLLAEFLRESLALGTADRIPIARELKLAERFLAIERVRFGDRLAVHVEAGDAGSCLVPPLLLQPVVENAVTHGIAHMLAGGTIRITASRTDSTLSVIVENPCDSDRPPGAGGGMGLANVRARLRALYGADAWMSAGEQQGIWRVEMAVPLRDWGLGGLGTRPPSLAV